MLTRNAKPRGKKRKPARRSRVERIDPTRTTTLRRAFANAISKRFARLRLKVVDLIERQDAFGIKRRQGLGQNTRWATLSQAEQIRRFRDWLQEITEREILEEMDELLKTFIQQGLQKGAARAFDDVTKAEKALAQSAPVRAGQQPRMDFYQGSRQQFLRMAFNQPVAKEKVQLLLERAFTDLKGVTEQMATQMARVLADGLVQGKSPRDVGRELAKTVDGIGRKRADTIARTETIRAHAQGQLIALRNLGVEEIGVAVEWTITDDDRLCPSCAAMEGVVLKLDEAEGLIPRHPSCRCSFRPANVGEKDEDQVDTPGAIRSAVRESIEEIGDGDEWTGIEIEIEEDRPQSILNQFSALLHNAFCPTGEGGGQDNSCAPGKGGGDTSKFTGATVGAAEHQRADEVSNSLATALGGQVEEEVEGPGQKDKKPFDVRVPKKGGGSHDIEVKSLLKGTKQAISVHEDALLRKVEHQKANPENTFHTVVSDERETYGGGEYAENYSGHRLYYKRGSGRYSLSQMHQVKDDAELKQLLETPDDQLPERARGSLPPPPPVAHLRQRATQASESRRARDKARKERNKEKLREQARARAARARGVLV